MKRLILGVSGVLLTVASFAADRAAPDGEKLFMARCGYCHLAGGTGTAMLARRLGDEKALLAKRDDLAAAYVQHVVRNGLQSMPALTRVEVTDAELSAIADWLSRHPSR